MEGDGADARGARHDAAARRPLTAARETGSAQEPTPWQQIVEAFPHDSAPRFLIRDRDSIFGGEFRKRVKSIGLAEVLTTPRSPWQNPFAERVIGTIRRELLDHLIVLNERHLRRRLSQLSRLLPRLAHTPRSREGRA